MYFIEKLHSYFLQQQTMSRNYMSFLDRPDERKANIPEQNLVESVSQRSIPKGLVCYS